MRDGENRGVRSRFTSRRGAMLVFVAVSMTALLGIVALSVDIGAGNRVRRIAQTAADAAALGGANEILRGSDSAAVVAAAVAAYNKAGNAIPGTVPNVYHPPATGTYAGNKKFIEVTVARTIPTIFGFAVGTDSLVIQARGVAGASAANRICIFGLASTGNAIEIPNGGDVDAGSPGNGCAIVSNSGIMVKNGGSMSGESISAVGGITIGPPGSSTPEYPNIPPVVDPLAYLTAPAETSCDFTDFKVNGTMNLTPGVYCGGIELQGVNGTRANLAPGTYILRGGGIQGGKNEIVGTGVTIINTNGPGNDPNTFAPIEFENNCLIDLSAPTTGPFAGVVIFTPPDAPFAVNTFCGMGDLTGAVYMPSQEFQLVNANGKLSITGSLFANRITTENGGGKLDITSDLSGGAAAKRISLVQ